MTGRAMIALLAAVILLSGANSRADDSPSDKLRRIETEIEKHEQTKRGLDETRGRLTREVTVLTGQLIETAATIQTQEEKVSELESSLASLMVVERQRARELEERTGQLAHGLAALERLSRQPNLVLISRNASTVDSLRAASLLASLVPELQSRAAVLGDAIVSLDLLRRNAENERAVLVEESERLILERARIDGLLDEKAGQETEIMEAAAVEQRRLEALGREAADLRALIARLERDAREQEKRGDLAALPDGGQPFSAVRGRLALPARGRLVRGFRQPDENGHASKGILVETRLGAQVVAPYDGRIVFAGAFRNYGELLIIAHGEGYHTVLVGLSRIDGVVGQWLLTGEPVGQMGGDAAEDASRPKPTLYIELRRNGEPINPTIWLAVGDRKVSG